MEMGIKGKRGVFFPPISEFSKNNLLYVNWGATYNCVIPYEVRREFMDSSIIFYITEGELTFDYREHTFTAYKDQIVLLNGHYPNHYFTKSEVVFDWFHFNGQSSQAYVELLYNNHGALFTENIALLCKPYFKEILKEVQITPFNEHQVATHIQNLFTHLLKSQPTSYDKSWIIEVCAYMEDNFKSSHSVNEIAATFNLSRFHFSRKFKEATDETPHQYLQNIRIHNAKIALTNTSKSIEDIGIECGFNSTSHFIRMFKQTVGTTPYQFKKLNL